MTGGHNLGHWEAKNCKSFKALAVCEQSVNSDHDILMPITHWDILAPCKDGWESKPGLSDCYKVRTKGFMGLVMPRFQTLIRCT